MWFTDEKIFTVATPINPQNDRLFSPTSSKKEIAPERRHARLSARRWWHQLVCQSWDKRSWYSSILQWRSMAHTTVMCFTASHSAAILPVVQEISGDFFILHKTVLQTEVWWVRWPYVWRYGLSFSNVCLRPEFMTSISCDSVYSMYGAAWSSRWLMTQLTNAKRACVLMFVPV